MRSLTALLVILVGLAATFLLFGKRQEEPVEPLRVSVPESSATTASPAATRPGESLIDPERRLVSALQEAVSTVLPAVPTQFPPGIVFGCVFDGETSEPLSGVKVRIDSIEVETDAAGEFRIEGLVLGGRTLRLEVGLDGFEERSERLRFRASGTLEHDVRLFRRRGLEIVVFNRETGLPITGALETRSDVRSDKLGHLETQVAPFADELGELRFRLKIEAPGYATLLWLCEVDVLPSTVRLPLVPLAYVEGMLRGVDGRPIGQAIPQLQVLIPSKPNTRIFSPTAEDRLLGIVGHGSYHSSKNFGPTDDDGRFVLGVLPGESTVRVRFELEGGEAASERFVLSRPDQRIHVNLVLKRGRGRGGALIGRVLCNEEPWRGYVTWKGEKQTAWSRCDAQGEFSFTNVETGDVRVLAGKIAAPFAETQVWVRGGEETTCDLSFQAETIAGQVMDGEENPLAGAMISVRSLDVRFEELVSRSWIDGSFAAQAVPPGDLIVTAMFEQKLVRKQTRAGDQEIEFVLTGRLGRLRLSFVDGSSGELIPPICDDEPPILWWRPAGEGVFRIYIDGEGMPCIRSSPTELALPVGLVDIRTQLPGEGYMPQTVERIEVSDQDEPGPVVVTLWKGTTLVITPVAPKPAPSAVDRPIIFLVEESQLSAIEGPFPKGDPRATQEFGDLGFRIHDRALIERCRILAAGEPWTLKALAPGRYHFIPAMTRLTIEPAWIDVPQAERFEVEVRVSWK